MQRNLYLTRLLIPEEKELFPGASSSNIIALKSRAAGKDVAFLAKDTYPTPIIFR